MHIAFLDESSQDANEVFTVCGLTALEIEGLANLHEFIGEIRRDHGYTPELPLKWTLPTEWSRDTHGQQHTAAKSEIMSLCTREEVSFFGYVHFNGTGDQNDATRNATFGFNTLLKAFNSWLARRNSKALVVFDRMDWNGAYEYCVEKYTIGLTYPPALNRADEELSNVLSYSMASSRMSDLCSINDVFTGALNYVANVDHAIETRQRLVRSLANAMEPGENGARREQSFFQRPYDRTNLPEEVASRYGALIQFMNDAM